MICDSTQKYVFQSFPRANRAIQAEARGARERAIVFVRFIYIPKMTEIKGEIYQVGRGDLMGNDRNNQGDDWKKYF